MMQGTIHLEHTLGAKEDRDGGMIKYHKNICHMWNFFNSRCNTASIISNRNNSKYFHLLTLLDI